MFLMSIASIGVIATMAPAGAGEPMSDKNCKISVIKDGNDSVPKELSTDEIPREISFPSHCATLEVTKVVTGTPPPGTEFSEPTEVPTWMFGKPNTEKTRWLSAG